ncbi:MAG TPA: flagellar biosynthesis protein FlhB [Aliidongia sp.]|nr:flagellar biosynthesis protein FlhB [Aliidongia sp.]
MADDQDSKTEQPTGRRLGEAREKGQVAISRDVTTAISLTAATVATLMILPWSLQPLLKIMRGFIAQPERVRIVQGPDLQQLFATVCGAMALSLALPFAVLLAAGLTATFFQTNGFLWATSKFTFSLNFLNPLSGFSRLFSRRGLVEFGKGLIKVAIIGTVVYLVLKPDVMKAEIMIGMEPIQMLDMLRSEVQHLLESVILSIGSIASLDYFYQKWSTLQQLKMSKQEVKDEHKNAEGDQHIKGRQRQIRVTRAKKRMLQSVPKASVVVTNPTHFAVALQYEMGANGAPRVVAKGVDFLAFKIREIAEANGVPIVENPPVARALYATVDIDDEIPTEHYKAVAEIISYVMKLRRWKAAG